MKKFILPFIIILTISPTILAQNTFPSAGSVGIGTLTPEYPLDIQAGFEVPVIVQLGTRQLYTGNAGVGFGLGVFSNVTPSDNLYSVAIGDSALFQNQTGRYNVAVGLESLKNNLSGEYNVGVGREALKSNIIGQNNVAVGSAALISNKGGKDNVAIGANSLQNNKNSNRNSVVGSNAMVSNIKGFENTAIGYVALYENTKGNYNTAIGSGSLYDNKLGSYNSALGYIADATENNFNNISAFGYDVLVDASNKIVLGNASVSSIGGEVDWTVYSDARIKEQVEENVPGLAFIKQLRPVTYHYNITKQNQIMGRIDTAQWTGKYDIEQMAFSGFIAQEVAAAAEDLGYSFSGVDESGRLMGLRYATFVVPLVQAVQELDAENTALEEELSQVVKENEALKARLDRIEQLLNIDQEETWRQSSELGHSAAMLGQNSPNPFTGNTVIPVFVPEGSTHAVLLIADLQGRVIETISLATGYGNIELHAGQLTPGSYFYSLEIAGRQVDSRMMQVQ